MLTRARRGADGSLRAGEGRTRRGSPACALSLQSTRWDDFSQCLSAVEWLCVVIAHEQLSQSLLMECNTHRTDPKMMSSQKLPGCAASAVKAQKHQAGSDTVIRKVCA